MLTQLDLLKENFVLAGDSAKFAGAMQKEFENRAKTTANNLIITKNKMSELAITAGGVLLPSLNSLLDTVGNGAVSLARFAEANPQVVSAVMYTVSALAAFKVASLAGGYALTFVSDAWQMAKGAWAMGAALCRASTYAMIYQSTVSKVLAAGTRMLTIAQTALNYAFRSSPLGWIVTGLSAVAAGLVYLYNNCEPVRQALDWLWDAIKAGIQPVLSFLESVWEKIKNVFGGIKSIMSWFDSDDAKEAEIKVKEEKEIAVTHKAEQESPGAAIPQGRATASAPGAFPALAPAPVPQMVDLAPPPMLPGPGMETALSGLSAISTAMESVASKLEGIAADIKKAVSLVLVPTGEKAMAHAAAGASAPSSWSSRPAPSGVSTLQGPQAGSSTPAAPVHISPSLQLVVNMNGVTDKDFGKRVMGSLEQNRTGIERFFGSLFKDQSRLTYG